MSCPWIGFDGTLATAEYPFELIAWAIAIVNGSLVIATESGVSPTGRQCAAQGLGCDGSDLEISKRSDRTATVDWKAGPSRMGSSSYDAEMIAWSENETNVCGTAIAIGSMATGFALCAN